MHLWMRLWLIVMVLPCDVHMHRAQLRVIRRDLEAAKNDLEACIAVAPGHVLARLRLATVLIHRERTRKLLRSKSRLRNGWPRPCRRCTK